MIGNGIILGKLVFILKLMIDTILARTAKNLKIRHIMTLQNYQQQKTFDRAVGSTLIHIYAGHFLVRF